MKKYALIILALVFALVGCKKSANTGHETKTAKDANGYNYEYVENDPSGTRIYTLDNGLKVYLAVNKDEPRIQTYIAVRAGAKNDPRETTGLAHYFEHMMFKGNDRIASLEPRTGKRKAFSSRQSATSLKNMLQKQTPKRKPLSTLRSTAFRKKHQSTQLLTSTTRFARFSVLLAQTLGHRTKKPFM